MISQVHDERAAAAEMADVLDHIRFDEIARLAALAVSYGRSIGLAADRGDGLTVAVHTKQVDAVIRGVFTLVGELARETEGSSS
jgi:hypothetical protein